MYIDYFVLLSLSIQSALEQYGLNQFVCSVALLMVYNDSLNIVKLHSFDYISCTNYCFSRNIIILCISSFTLR